MGNTKADEYAGFLQTLRIIIGALTAGVLFFLIIVIVFLRAAPQPLDAQAIVSMTLAAFALSCIPARLFVPGLIVSASCQKIAEGTWSLPARQSNQPLPDTDEGKLLAVYQSKTILGAAILEGGAFANLVAYLLEGQIYSIVLAVLFMLGILAAFPTSRGLHDG